MGADFRVRFAPSPTGYLHIGGARTALFNWLLARQKGGVFVLRMEDTDEERNTEAARSTIFRGLDWLGLRPDEGPEQGGPFGPYSQSERTAIYRQHAGQLIESKALYPCFCSKERLAELRARQEAAREGLGYDGRCRTMTEDEIARRLAAGETPSYRLKVPAERSYRIEDRIRGTVEVSSKDIGDIILVRANGIPVYNFAVVVDDHLMRISHVVRGEDHLTNTFNQLVIYEAFGWTPPIFAHLPLILAPAGEGKLSKRKHPEAALELYQSQGYPVEGLVNWLALIGWSFDGATEVMSRAELVERFSLEKVSPGGARLPMDKLDWICGESIRRMSDDEVAAGIRPVLEGRGFIRPGVAEPRLALLARAFRERLRSFGQIEEMAAWIFDPEIAPEAKALKNLQKEGALGILSAYRQVLPRTGEPTAAELEAEARRFCEERGIGFGALVHPLRAALTRRSQGPGLFDCVLLLGLAESHRRLEGVGGWASNAEA